MPRLPTVFAEAISDTLDPSGLNEILDDFESRHFCGSTGGPRTLRLKSVPRPAVQSTDPVAGQIIGDLRADRCSIEEAILGIYHARIPLSQIRPLISAISGQSRRIDFLDECVYRVVKHLRRWNARKITVPYSYLIFDTVHLRVRVRPPTEVHRFHVGFACGGRGSAKEALGTWPDSGSASAAWADFFASIKARGLRNPRLVVVPPDEAALRAAGEAFPKALLQIPIAGLVREMERYVEPKHLPHSTNRFRAVHRSTIDSKLAGTEAESLAAAADRIAHDGESARLARYIRLSASYLRLPAQDRHLIRQNHMVGTTALALRMHTCKIAAGVTPEVAELMVLARLRWLSSTKWASRTRPAGADSADLNGKHSVRARRSA